MNCHNDLIIWRLSVFTWGVHMQRHEDIQSASFLWLVSLFTPAKQSQLSTCYKFYRFLVVFYISFPQLNNPYDVSNPWRDVGSSIGKKRIWGPVAGSQGHSIDAMNKPKSKNPLNRCRVKCFRSKKSMEKDSSRFIHPQNLRFPHKTAMPISTLKLTFYHFIVCTTSLKTF